MNIHIQKPVSLSEIGRRINNEDSIYPRKEDVSTNDRLFIVCDGVGGSNKGEIASSIACDSIHTYFKTFLNKDEPFDPGFIEKAIRYTEICFDEYLIKNPEAKGMATTISLLYISKEGAYTAHAGDSRIYQIRNGKIVFKTEDHSLISSLVKNGQVTAEQARKHPQKNVIFRAVQGSHMPVEIEIASISEIFSGDQFFMCTDGINEALTDDEICSILTSNDSPESKISEIKEHCINSSKDNYSAYLIPVQEIIETSTFKQIFASFLYAFM